MNVTAAERMNAFSQSIFAELTQMKKSKISKGNHVIDLSIGTPDLQPPSFVRQALIEGIQEEKAFAYSLTGTKDFNQSVAIYYNRNFSVQVNPENEVLLLMGSQDGLVHLPMVLCDPGDYILMPDPGYPAYMAGAAMAGATIFPMPLLEENAFLPDLTKIPVEVLDKAKLMVLNFPGNPVPAMATNEFFLEVVDFAKKNNIVVLHDFAYSELYFSEQPISFLSVPGAKDVGIEMNSLSKSFCMAGSRVAYATGNPKIIELLAQLKSNLDYGVFYPVQAAASLALKDESDYLEQNRKIYKHRRDILVNGFKELGWEIDSPKASMFIWAKIPIGFTSTEFTIQLLQKANVMVTPGSAFGKNGEGYVRIALVQSEFELMAAIENIKKSGIFTAVSNC
jgi:LL-diaminopimelate aminotransferase